MERSHAIGDAGPGVALGAPPRRRNSWLELLREALGVAGGARMPSTPSVTTSLYPAMAAIAGVPAAKAQLRPCRSSHLKATAHRGRQVMKRAPEVPTADSSPYVDPAQCLGVSEVAEHVLALGANHG